MKHCWLTKILFILLLLNNLYCFSQNVIDSTNSKPFKQHTVYVEWLGNALLLYSVGYDYTLKIKEKHKLSFNFGFQYLPFFLDQTFVSLSPQISYLYGKTHHLEVGLGITAWEVFHDDGGFNISMLMPLRIGYRYQKDEGGVFFKIAYTPFVYRGRDAVSGGAFKGFLWGGIAVGYTFK